MKKNSVYLDDVHVERLRLAAQAEGRSQADILREAILAYTNKGNHPPRKFAISGVAPGGIERRFGRRSIADIPGEELLQGFGD